MYRVCCWKEYRSTMFRRIYQVYKGSFVSEVPQGSVQDKTQESSCVCVTLVACSLPVICDMLQALNYFEINLTQHCLLPEPNCCTAKIPPQSDAIFFISINILNISMQVCRSNIAIQHFLFSEHNRDTNVDTTIR